MNRPMLEDYYDASQAPTFEYDMDAYFKDLEKYCNELEAENKELTYVNGSELLQMYKEFFWEYQKALDKAIDMLDLLDSQVCFLDDRFTRKTKEEWEAWLFEDE